MDTNLLVYYFDYHENEKHERAKKIVNSFAGSLHYFISQQNLREFASVLFEKKKVSAMQIQNYLHIIQSMFVVLDEKPRDVIQAVEWSEEFKTSYWDSLLAATAQRYGIRTIYTENVKDFDKIPGIHVLNPLK